jgi:hypothetical protein
VIQNSRPKVAPPVLSITGQVQPAFTALADPGFNFVGFGAVVMRHPLAVRSGRR